KRAILLFLEIQLSSKLFPWMKHSSEHTWRTPGKSSLSFNFQQSGLATGRQSMEFREKEKLTSVLLKFATKKKTARKLTCQPSPAPFDFTRRPASLRPHM